MWGMPGSSLAPWHKPRERELSLGVHLLMTKQYLGKRKKNTAFSALFNNIYMLQFSGLMLSHPTVIVYGQCFGNNTWLWLFP